LRLTPVAALLAAFVLLGSATADMGFTVDDWALNADDTSAWLLQSDVSPDEKLDALVESIVTGEDPAGTGGASDAGK